jgi:hypothetical protein
LRLIAENRFGIIMLEPKGKWYFIAIEKENHPIDYL